MISAGFSARKFQNFFVEKNVDLVVKIKQNLVKSENMQLLEMS